MFGLLLQICSLPFSAQTPGRLNIHRPVSSSFPLGLVGTEPQAEMEEGRSEAWVFIPLY